MKGFATAGVLGSSTGKGDASYSWWTGFLRNVVPNASWIAKVHRRGELAIGIALILGLLAGLAAFAGLGDQVRIDTVFRRCEELAMMYHRGDA